ncbi:hypothetical protein L873DRAFT_1856218 [Choiromyces venosus 120613-1]|uniref:Uncharacterized protein n=1 Tax=Choiromyces venosus 120613-1 TaxID=1336337 RepID=A0A3N4K2T6_9PEZI|nr:hypothetical protein L873DRAFT_1856218 [Choiromyces venosus 120613-1]
MQLIQIIMFKLSSLLNQTFRLKSQLQETLEVACHLDIFYPIYYCELNFIEYF